MSANPLDGLDDEIRLHLAAEIQTHVDRGMAPAAARALAHRKFGSIALAKEDARAVWIPGWLDRLRQDLRDGLRLLRRAPAFCAVIVFTLAIGIGMNTAVFSVIQAVLLRPLSFAHPERMVWLTTMDPKSSDHFITSQDVLAWTDTASVDRLIAYDIFDGRVVASGNVSAARIATVTADFWDAANAQPVLGKLPGATESEVLLSHGFFERVFGARADVMGMAVQVGGRPATIAGVLPRGFHVDLPLPEVWVGQPPKEIDVYQGVQVRTFANGMLQLFRGVARLKPGVSMAQAQSELQSIKTRVAVEHPGGLAQERSVHIVPLTERLVGSARTNLWLLLGAVLLVLLVGCSNIAGLMLARAGARQKEMAIRIAAGAARSRIIRQLLAESLGLAIIGSLAGLLVARECLNILFWLIPGAIPRLTDAALDGRVLWFALTLSLLTTFVFGVGPALALSDVSAYDVLKDGTRTISATLKTLRARQWLVTAEIVLALTLLSGAGLLIRSLSRITDYPAGFVPQQTLTIAVEYGGGRREGREVRRRQYITEVLQRLQPVSGVAAVGLTTNESGRMRLIIENAPPAPPDERPGALSSVVSEGYARAIGMRIIAGRWITDREPEQAFVLNESLTRRAFGDESPIGHRLQIDGPPGADAAGGARFAPIVGVVADLKYNRLETDAEPQLFTDYQHAQTDTLNFVARVTASPATVGPVLRSLVAEVDQTQLVSGAQTVESVLHESIAPRRFTVFMLVIFAGTALLVALVGVYGVIAYATALRTREIGVRVALGAGRGSIAGMILQQGVTMLAVGIPVGLLVALAASRVMRSLLYAISPTDPLAYAGGTLLIGVATLAATLGPALKAARLDPNVALRSD